MTQTTAAFEILEKTYLLSAGLVHALARRAIVSFPLLVWMEHVPSDIDPFVISNIPGS